MAPLDTPTPKKLTKKDFTSDQEVRWCPGCGDYAILAAIQRTLPELGVSREKSLFISGIGCSSRFPYYMDTYGFHTIHGRAPAFATGVKLVNPELDVWLITGDGDGLSIGGNHLLHVLRRNVNLQVMMFNNRIYGLTKGQYSPTSLVGLKSPSSPMGSIDMPVNPMAFALGANARFVSRGIDTMIKPLSGLFKEAHAFKGTSFIEILQNCPVFNDGTWTHVTAREVSDEMQLWVEHGKPMLFGPDKNKGLVIEAGEAKVVTLGEDGITEADVTVHDETNLGRAFILAHLLPPLFPMVFGVVYRSPAPAYDEGVATQVAEAVQKNGEGDINALLRSGHTWTVE